MAEAGRSAIGIVEWGMCVTAEVRMADQTLTSVAGREGGRGNDLEYEFSKECSWFPRGPSIEVIEKRALIARWGETR